MNAAFEMATASQFAASPSFPRSVLPRTSDMPGYTRYIQAQPMARQSPRHGVIVREDGEIECMSETNGSITTIRDEEILFIKRDRETSTFVIVYLSEDQDKSEDRFCLEKIYAEELPHKLLSCHLVERTPRALELDAEDQLHVIVSTKSGVGLAKQFYETVLEPLLDFGELKLKSCNVVITQSSNTVKEFAGLLWDRMKAKTTPRHTIILLSGDGGVVDLLNGMGEVPVETQLPSVAILPLGTGNALFHSLHKPHYSTDGRPSPSPLVLGIRSVFRGASAPLPIFQASFSPGSKLVSYAPPRTQTNDNSRLEEHTETISHLFGAIVASHGFHAQLVWESDTPEYRRHGDKRFGMVAEELLKTSHAYTATVEMRNPGGSGLTRLKNDKFNYILATMVSNLEKTFTISPSSKPLDGKLRLVHFGDVGGQKTIEIMSQAYREGAHVDMRWRAEDGKEESVGYDEIEEVTVTVLEKDPRWRKVCIDGTIVEVPEGGSMTVRREVKARYEVVIH
jgi:diacylglycerol kinase family enzyme